MGVRMRDKLINKIKSIANDIEVKGFDFLNIKGEYCKGMKECETVNIYFIDGQIFNITIEEFRSFGNYEFKLRPKTDDG